MRLLTKLRRLDNSKKDTVILVTTFFLTICIIMSGFLYTKTLTKEGKGGKSSTTTISSIVKDIKATLIPTITDMKDNIEAFSDEYEKGSFKDFFVPKSE